jgi:hypothetical protein
MAAETTRIRTVALAAIFAITLALLPISPTAYASDDDFIIEWIEDYTGYGSRITGNFVVEYTGAGGDVVIPDGVYGIQSMSFRYNTSITSVYIPDSVQMLDSAAFEGCTSLKSARLPRELVYITGWLFRNCTSLETIIMPERMIRDPREDYADYRNIYAEAFRGTKLKNVIIPIGTTSIDSKAFYDCDLLESVTVPSSVRWIDDNAFDTPSSSHNIVIYGEAGSEAQRFARDCGYGFNKPYEPPDFNAEAEKFIAELPAYKFIDSSEIKARAAQLLDEKSKWRDPHVSVPLGYITHITRSMTRAERYAAILRGMRSDSAALDFYSQPNYGFETSNTSGFHSLVLEKLAKRITNGLTTDYEKALAIHSWVADNIYYDYPLMRSHEDENAPKPEKSASTPLDVLELGRTVCNGYSRLTASLLRSIGIPARYVTGNGIPGHAWNEVFADNRWILVDTTWDSGNAWDNGDITASGGIDTSLRYFDAEISSFASKHNVGETGCSYSSGFGAFGDFLGIITLDDTLSRVWTLPDEWIDEFTIPSYVTNMGSSSTTNTDIRANIKKLVIPNDVAKISWGSQPGGGYRGVEHLVYDRSEVPYRIGSMWGAAELTLGANVKSIGDQALTTNVYLHTVDLPETIQELNATAFDYCRIYGVAVWNPNIKLLKTDNFSHGGGIAFYAPIGSATEKSLLAQFAKYDFHGNRVLPLELTPSEWAKTDIGRAKSLGIVPYYLDYASTVNITRIEFCRLAVALYEKLEGMAPLPDYLSTDPRGTYLYDTIDEEYENPVTFADAWDMDVYKMYALGVVNGVGKDEYGRDIFDPYGELTREQAAAMLARLSAALGKPLAGAAPTFSDAADISAWAAGDVGKIQTSGIMSGVGGGNFDPQGKYTREQSIVTMLRLIDMAS